MDTSYLLQVKRLLSDAFDVGFYGEADFGDLETEVAGVVGFAEDRVGFAIHFLQEEVDLLAGFAAFGQ